MPLIIDVYDQIIEKKHVPKIIKYPIVEAIIEKSVIQRSTTADITIDRVIISPIIERVKEV